MRNHTRLKESRVVRLAASAVAVAALAGATGIVASQGNAAAAIKADKATHPPKKAKFKQPKLKHGVLTITGTNASDKIALRLKAGKTGILQIDVGDDGSANFSFKRKQIAKIAVNAGAGADRVRIDERNGVFTDRIRTRIAGEAGNDTLLGGSGTETLLGGNGNDVIDGNGGNDMALLGAGDDTFVWDPGDGSDVVEGGRGRDTLVFNGSAGNEIMAATAVGERVSFTRNLGNIVMDLDGVEAIAVRALGGTDTVTVNDVGGTDWKRVNVDLAATIGGSTADGQADTVTVTATKGDDSIAVDANGAAVDVSGLAAFVRITHADAASDTLVIDPVAGADQVAIDPAVNGLIQVSVL